MLHVVVIAQKDLVCLGALVASLLPVGPKFNELFRLHVGALLLLVHAWVMVPHHAVMGRRWPASTCTNVREGLLESLALCSDPPDSAARRDRVLDDKARRVGDTRPAAQRVLLAEHVAAMIAMDS